MIENHNIMTDPELYALCKKWGEESLEARRKFIGLLPEVYKRRLFERHGFTSIYHFAAKLGGVSEALVNDVLRLEKRFELMPTLHLVLVKGEIGLSKLARVASIAEVKNEAEICEKIRTLSRRAVDVLVKDIKTDCYNTTDNDGFFETKNTTTTLSGQNFSRSLSGRQVENSDYKIIATLSPEVKIKLKELMDKKIDINSIILLALKNREAEIEQEKTEIGETPAKSRYIPLRIKRLLKAEFGQKCAHQNCHKLAEQIHHEKHYSGSVKYFVSECIMYINY